MADDGTLPPPTQKGGIVVATLVDQGDQWMHRGPTSQLQLPPKDKVLFLDVSTACYVTVSHSGVVISYSNAEEQESISAVPEQQQHVEEEGDTSAGGGVPHNWGKGWVSRLVRCNEKLAIRSSAAIDADVVGHLPKEMAGLVVLETRITPDGRAVARIAACNATRERGWVLAIGPKDGRVLLELEFEGTDADYIEPVGAQAQHAGNRRSVLQTIGAFFSGGGDGRGSLLSRLTQMTPLARMTRVSGGGLQEGSFLQRAMGGRKTNSIPEQSAFFGGIGKAGSGGTSSKKGGKVKGGGGGGGGEAKVHDHHDVGTDTLKSSIELTTLAAEHFALAGELEAQVMASRSSFERELAIAIEKRRTPAYELFEKFQHGRANDQQIFKGEFRQFIKQQMKINTDIHKIDALFERLDEDNGGSLDLIELSHAIDNMHKAEIDNEKMDEQTMVSVGRLRSTAEQLLNASRKMVIVEETRGKYSAVVQPKVDERMGALVLARLRKGDSVQYVSKEWDLNGNGKFSRYELHRLIETCLKEPPSEALDADVDRLFDRYAALEHLRAPDTAGVVELKVGATVKLMMDTEASRRAEVEKLKKEVEKKEAKAAKEQPDEMIIAAASEMAEAEEQRLAHIQAAKDAQIQAEKELEMKRQLGRSGGLMTTSTGKHREKQRV